MPDWGPFDDTRREARLLAISDALLLKSPAGGKVELVLTVATQRLRDFPPREEFVAAISPFQSGSRNRELQLSSATAIH
jgi:hypothetical protein